MKRTIFISFCIISFLMTCISISAATKEKTIKTKLQNNVTLEYNGGVEDKLPMGVGKITLIKNDKIVDRIEGAFNNHTIKNATMVLKEGYSFKGDIDYSTTDQDIIYTLTNGCFEVNLNYSTEPLSIPLKTTMPIHRSFSDLKMTSEVSLSIVFPTIEVVQKVPTSKLYEGFIGAPIEIKKVEFSTFHLEGATITSNKISNEDNYYDLSYGDKGSGKYYNNKWLLEINCPNGDYLKSEDRETHSFDMKRHVEGGTIETHLIYEKNYVFNSPWDPQVQNSELANKFYENMPKEYVTLKDSMRTMSIDHRLYLLYEIGKITYDEVRDNSMYIAIEARYDNGDYYMGSIYYPNNDGSLNDIISMAAMPQENDYFTGVLTTKGGEKHYFIEGYEASTLRELMDAYVADKKEQDEKFERERDEKNAAREKENKEYRDNLTKQYGKQYVDAMFDQHTILVGTPEGLLKEYYFCTVALDMDNTVVYNVTRSYGTQFVVHVDKKTHKVTAVVHKQ